jgi:hypothetical protein
MSSIRVRIRQTRRDIFCAEECAFSLDNTIGEYATQEKTAEDVTHFLCPERYMTTNHVLPSIGGCAVLKRWM